MLSKIAYSKDVTHSSLFPRELILCAENPSCAQHAIFESSGDTVYFKQNQEIPAIERENLQWNKKTNIMEAEANSNRGLAGKLLRNSLIGLFVGFALFSSSSTTVMHHVVQPPAKEPGVEEVIPQSLITEKPDISPSVESGMRTSSDRMIPDQVLSENGIKESGKAVKQSRVSAENTLVSIFQETNGDSYPTAQILNGVKQETELQKVEKEHQANLTAIEEVRQMKLNRLNAEKVQREKEIREKKASEKWKERQRVALDKEIKDRREGIEQFINGRVAIENAVYHAKLASIKALSLSSEFSQMTQKEQYDFLREIYIAMTGGDESQWKTGDKEVNIIGIRGWQDGKPVVNKGNLYNDTIFAVRLVDGKPEVYAFSATVDAGINPGNNDLGYRDASGRFLGYSHLADGFYPNGTFYEREGSKWDVDIVLSQRQDVRINVDTNNDGVIQDNERLNITVPLGWGISFHPGGKSEKVGSWSAGCQVIRPENWKEFQKLLKESPDYHYGYVLVDGSAPLQ